MSDKEYGIGRYSLEMARHILLLDSKNDYFLFVRDPANFGLLDKHFALPSNCKIVAADFRHYSFDEQLFFLRLLNKYNLDLVHFMNFNVPLFYNRPYIVTIHDMVHHRLPGNKPRYALHRAAYRHVIANAATKSKKIITVSNVSKKEISELLMVPADKIRVIYEAATVIAVTEADCVAVRQKYGIYKPYLIFVGVIERKKNILALASAFDALKEKFGQNIQLVLTGKVDPYYPHILEAVKQAKYARDILYTGVVSDKEKFALLKGARAFVSASLFEGFGLPGLEAMSMAVPLAVSNIPVFNEVYDNGAIYFDASDFQDIAVKINLLLSDPKYRGMVAENAFFRARHFSWEKAAAETLVVYKDCFQNRL